MAKADATNSPAVTGYSVRGENQGDDAQWIIARLEFDRAISVHDGVEKEIKVLIGGNRVSDEKIKIKGVDDTHIDICMSVSQVTNGKMMITNAKTGKIISKLTDKTGKYSVAKISIDCLIPSGVKLEVVSSTAATDNKQASITEKVTSVCTHRSITWIQITDNGKTVVPDLKDTTDVMDNAIAVHEHDFLWATEETIASDIAEAINYYFSDEYFAIANGDEVTLTKKQSLKNELINFSIYTY